jgi:hypothetical protein
MPRHWKAMKDVLACDKLGGVGKKTTIPKFLNEGTQSFFKDYLHPNT